MSRNRASGLSQSLKKIVLMTLQEYIAANPGKVLFGTRLENGHGKKATIVNYDGEVTLYYDDQSADSGSRYYRSGDARSLTFLSAPSWDTIAQAAASFKG
jgi:hypothetical protein